MKKFLLVFSLTILSVPSVFAQRGEEDVTRIFFDTITTGAVEPTQIAVEDMKYVGATYITGADSLIMANATAVIQFDIDFWADFELTIADSFYMKTYEIRELDFLSWQRLGADYVLRLEAEFPGPNIRVRWRLYDAVRRSEIAKGQEEYERYSWRTMAHQISNEIVRTLTGERGLFHTQVCYIRKIGKSKEVFISDYDGANEVQLTKLGTISVSPIFSPNRDEIYFCANTDGGWNLHKVDIATRKVTKLTSFKGLAAAPSISPDGNRIALVLSKDGNSELYLLDTQGKVIQRLTNHPAIETAPTWSPDGQWIAFASDRTGSPQIYLMDDDGFNVKRLTFEGKYNDSPVWSSRGDRVTFVTRAKNGQFHLASIDTSGTDFRVLTAIGTNENPHFSPDGKHLIFSSNRLGNYDVFTSDLSGRNQRRITRSADATNPSWGPWR